MKMKIFWFLVFAIGFNVSSSSAASISTRFVLLTQNDDVIVPDSPNHYTIALGTTFKIRLLSAVLSPNLTDNARTGTGYDSVPLGIQNLTGNIVSSGVNIVNPVGDGLNFPPRWLDFHELIGTANPEFAELIDVDSDGDFDVSGCGFINTALILPNPNPNPAIRSIFLSLYQAGVDPLQLIGQPLFEGLYKANSFGVATIAFDATNAFVYADAVGGTTALVVQDVLNTFSHAPITINSLPEPSTIALAGMGLVGLVFAMRRKTA